MIAQHRWYLTLDGKAVKDGHPDANSLLVVFGGYIDDKEAARLGICTDEPEAKAIEAPLATKLITAKKTK